MTPGQGVFEGATLTSAQSMQKCAQSIADGAPLEGCSVTRLASGDTCPPPPTVVNGPISSDDPTSWKNNGKVPLGQPGGRVGFYFFTTLHGPFYQNTAWEPYMNAPQPVASPSSSAAA